MGVLKNPLAEDGPPRAPKSTEPPANGVEVGRMFSALAEEISDMEASRRALEGEIAQLRSRSQPAPNVAKSLQDVDHLVQRMGAMCRMMYSLALSRSSLDATAVSDARDDIVLEDIKKKLRSRIFGVAVAPKPVVSGDAGFY